MSGILSIGSKPIRDEMIVRKQFHTYSPYNQTFNNNDDVRIAIQSKDLYVLPSESYIYIEINVARKPGADYIGVAGAWTSNFATFLFSDIRYELNGIEIDRTKNVGMASNIKRFSANAKPQSSILMSTHSGAALVDKKYSVVIPLNQLMGFADDYRKIILNAKHELILTRNRKNIFSYQAQSEAFNISVEKVQWKIPHIHLADHAKLQLLKYLEKEQSISVNFRSWDLYELPQVPQSTKHIWTIKSTTQLTKPRFVFVVFQTNKQVVNANSASFDNCTISDVKLYLNSEYYPYDNFNSEFAESNYQELYYALMQVQSVYYNNPEDKYSKMVLTYDQFQQNPIFAFDCTRSDESLLGGTVDVRLEINSRQHIPANTVAYCLIVHDNHIEYSPFTGIVTRSV